MRDRDSPRIALATAAHLPDLAPDDQPVLAALRARGVHAMPLVWSEPGPERPDVVVIRSCWDYHLRTREFFDWVNTLRESGVIIINPLPLLAWNAHKRYLIELAAVAPVPPIVWLPAGSDADAPLGLPREWTDVVVKPAISASAHDTWQAKLPLDRTARSRIGRMREKGDVMVQRFVREIVTQGETSFVFIDGAFSHAVQKLPAAGDFRVQAEHGGRAAAAAPRERDIRMAAAVVAVAPDAPLYARVDAVVTPDAFHLMELELIDPQLFFLENSQAVERFVKALIRRSRSVSWPPLPVRKR